MKIIYIVVDMWKNIFLGTYGSWLVSSLSKGVIWKQTSIVKLTWVT